MWDDQDIGDQAIEAVAHAVTALPELKALWLGSTGMQQEGAEALARALVQTHSLATLSVAGNQLGEGGDEAMARALLVNRSLTDLFLGSEITPLTWDGLNHHATCYPGGGGGRGSKASLMGRRGEEFATRTGSAAERLSHHYCDARVDSVSYQASHWAARPPYS